MPQKTAGGIKIEMALMEFCKKASVRLNNEIEKTLEKCIEFYKKICQVHKKCQLDLTAKITDLPNKDQHIAYLQDRLQEDVQYIQKMEVVNEEDVKNWVAQASVSSYILEDVCRSTPKKVTHVET